jgi:CRP-like cAMP-binding protein
MDRPFVSSIEVFNHLAGSPVPERATLENAASRRRLVAGDTLFRAGDSLPSVFVVNQGIIKLLYETPDGDTWIKAFIVPGICFASLTALEDGGVASFTARAEVDSIVDQIAYADLAALADRHLEWQRAVSNAYKVYGRRKERREMELLTLSAAARYVDFLREYPDIAAVLKQRDIASYVRVTPVALSRIKARIKTREARS